MPHPAIAMDGPLKDRGDLTVEPEGECSGFPCDVDWRDQRTGEVHRYYFEAMSMSRGQNLPVYKFIEHDELELDV